MRTKQGINDLIKGIIIEKGLNITDLEKTTDRIIEALTEENNLIIPNVVKSFYCLDKDTDSGQCKYQCDECIALDDNI